MVEPHLRKRSAGLFVRLLPPVKLWHAIYFPVFLLALTIAFCASGGVRGGFLDAVFLSVTTLTGAGLPHVANSELGRFQQAVVAVGIVGGGHVFLAIAVVNLQRVLLGRKLRRMRSEKDAESEAGSVRSVQPDVQLLPMKAEEGAAEGELRQTVVQGEEDTVLQQEQRYRALCVLSWLLPAYHLAFHVVAFVILGAWMHVFGAEILDVDGHGLNAWWWALFNTVSAFANSGMSLLDANIAPFQTGGVTVVLVHCVLILAGNAGFPTFLHGALLLLPKSCGVEHINVSIFPFLVPRYERNWLTAMLLILNCINWFIYTICGSLTYPLSDVLHRDSLVLTGLFQALSVRSGGFSIVNMSELHVLVIILYIGMMYLSAFPVSLHPGSGAGGGKRDFIRRQFKGLTRAGDVKFLALALFSISAIEGYPNSELVKVVFEIASAYGCVGVSFGNNPGEAFLATWGRGSRVIAAAVMLLGRTRELRRGILRHW